MNIKLQIAAERWFLYTGPRIIVVLLVAAVLLYFIRLATARMKHFGNTARLPTGLRAQQLETIAGLLNSVGAFLVVFLAAVHLLQVFGVDIKPILASAGVVGLAVGFGAQTLVKDVINGFFVVFEDQYQLGDTVAVAGVTGQVEEMTLRHTKLRDPNGALHMIPNSEIRIVSNLSRDWTQISLHAAVSYKEDSDRIIGILQQVGRELYSDPATREWLVAEPQVPGIEKVSGQEVDYLIMAKVKPGKHLEASRELRRRIKSAFEKNNVQIGGPQLFMLGG